MKLSFILILFILISCSAEKPKTSTAKLTISSKNFATAATTTEDEAADEPETIIYLINRTENKQRTAILSETQVTFELDFGLWDIAVLHWPHGGNSLLCGKSTKNFNKETDSVSIEVSDLNCSSLFFSRPDFLNGTSLKPVNLINCSQSEMVKPFTYCSEGYEGGIGSYKVAALAHDYMDISSLSEINYETTEQLKSSCLEASIFPDPLTFTEIVIPSGTDFLKIPFYIESFLSTDCSGESSITYFPNGYYDTPSTGESKIINDDLGVNIFTMYQGIFLAGLRDWGNVDIESSTSNSFIIFNNTDESLSNITLNIQAPFSLFATTCQGSLAPNSGCTVIINFDPTEENIFSNDLTMNYFVNNVSQEQKFKVSGSSSSESPPIAEDINIIGVPEDNYSIVQLSFSDLDGDAPESCEITSINNLILLRSCYCEGFNCFVDLITTPHSNESGTFTYTVNTNGITSNEATASISIDPQSDLIEALNLSRRFSIGSSITVRLEYDSPDNTPPESCTISDPGNLTILTNCFCNTTTNPVICETTVQAPATFNGVTSFQYFITDTNGVHSNIATVILNPNSPNRFVSLPQNMPNFYDLPTNNINSIFLEPSSDRVFLATEKGLSTVIGNIFSTKTTANGLIDNSLTSVVATGNYWFAGSNSGLSISTNNGESFSSYTSLDGLASNQMTKLKLDATNILYIGTTSGLSISTNYTVTPPTFTNFTQANSNLASNIINDILVTPGIDDTTYIATSNGLSIFQGNLISFLSGTSSFTNVLSGVNITAIAKDNTGFIYAASSDGVYKSNDLFSNFSLLNVNNNDIRSLHIDSLNRIFAATSMGLAISTDLGNTFTFYDIGINPSNNLGGVTYSETAEDIIVINDDGLAYSENLGSSWTQLSSANTALTPEVYDVAKNTYGYLFIATADGLGISYDGGNNFQYATIDQVNSIYIDPANKMFLATPNGLRISWDFGLTSDLKTTAHGLGSNYIYHITRGENGFIYASTDNGLSYSSDNGENFTNIPGTSLPGNKVFKTFIDSNFNIYVATDNGLGISQDNGATFSSYGITSGLNDLVTSDVVVNQNGYIYVGTSGGIYASYDSGSSFIKKDTTNGLPSNSIRSLTLDDYGVLYVGTSEGYAISVDNGNSYQSYDSTYGLPSNGVNKIYEDTHGAIFLATDNGLAASFSNVILALVNSANHQVENVSVTSASSTNLGYGLTNIGNMVTESVTVQTIGQSEWTSIQPTSTCPAILNPMESCIVNIYWNPPAAATSGDYLGELQIQDGGFPFSVNLRGSVP